MLIISHSGLDNEFLIGYFFEIYMLIISHNIIQDMVFIFSNNKTIRLFLFQVFIFGHYCIKIGHLLNCVHETNFRN